MKVSFIIPFHNEEKNVVPMIERVISYGRSQKWLFEIIPVDDRSTDSTPNLLKKLNQKYQLVKPIFRKDDGKTKGNTMGEALRAGTRAATGSIIIWTMGDMADDCNTYGAIVDQIKNGHDLVFASRYMLGGSRGNLDRVKASLSSWGTKLASVLFGITMHDITNAFRGFRKEIFTSLPIESKGFAISPEFAIRAHLAGYKLGEVPTVYTNRMEGISNFKLYSMTRSYLGLYWKLFCDYKLFHRVAIAS